MTKPLTIITAGALLLALTVVIACSDDEGPVASPTPSPAETPVPSQTATPTTIDFQTFLSGQNSGLTPDEPTLFKIETQAQWAELWDSHQSIVFPTATPPAFSFEGRTLIAVFDRTQPTGGFAIEIQAITRDGAGVIIEVVRTTPGAGCVVTQALTQPFHIVSVDAIDGDLHLALTDNITDCS